jgi:integrase/recombinase XerC
MLQKFYEYLRFEKRFSEHTLVAYTTDLEQFVVFSEVTSLQAITQLKSVFIRGWIVQLMEDGYSNKSVNRKLASLRTLFKWLRKEGISIENPMSRIRGPKVEKRLPSFAREQELGSDRTKHLFNNDFNGLRDELMLELFYQTGIRLSELIGLTLPDIQSNSIKVLGKRNKERIIPISSSLHQIIQRYIAARAVFAKSNRLLMLENGKPLYPAFVYRKIHQMLGTLTTLDKRSPHVLRHTFATHMLNNGAGLETLKALLGHASLAATQVYTHNSFAQLNQIYRHAHPRMNKN